MLPRPGMSSTGNLADDRDTGRGHQTRDPGGRRDMRTGGWRRSRSARDLPGWLYPRIGYQLDPGQEYCGQDDEHRESPERVLLVLAGDDLHREHPTPLPGLT